MRRLRHLSTSKFQAMWPLGRIRYVNGYICWRQGYSSCNPGRTIRTDPPQGRASRRCAVTAAPSALLVCDPLALPALPKGRLFGRVLITPNGLDLAGSANLRCRPEGAV